MAVMALVVTDADMDMVDGIEFSLHTPTLLTWN